MLVAVSADQFCPSANDFVAAYGSPQFKNRGWTITGGAGAATKASFNLLGGSVEFDVDFSKANLGVNANLYTISPLFSGSFQNGAYCDGQKTGDAFCAEIDWIESNGNCGGASTIHTRPGGGTTGCTAWGCSNTYTYNGQTSFHMKITYGTDGTMTILRNGQSISHSSYSPQPESLDVSTLQSHYQQRGAVIYSSQWVGWVPSINGCSGGNGDLGGSTYSISNLIINGKVVQGPTPTACSGVPVPVAPKPVPAAPKPVPVAPKPVPAAPKPVPAAPKPVPAAPKAPTSMKCAISGANNNIYYTEVSTVAGASVSVSCSSGSGTSLCAVSSWDPAVRQCFLQSCQSPKPSCSLNGLRIEGDDSATDSGSEGLAGWAIALIVVGSLLLVATVVVGVVLVLRPVSAETI